MMWAAVGCIVFALLLSMAGQFSHSWIVNNEEGGEGERWPHHHSTVDCSMAEGDSDETCQSKPWTNARTAYIFFAEDMEEAAEDDITVDDMDDAIVGDYEDYCDNIYTFAAAFAMGNETRWLTEPRIPGHLPRDARCGFNRRPHPLARFPQRPARHRHARFRLHRSQPARQRREARKVGRHGRRRVDAARRFGVVALAARNRDRYLSGHGRLDDRVGRCTRRRGRRVGLHGPEISPAASVTS